MHFFLSTCFLFSIYFFPYSSCCIFQYHFRHLMLLILFHPYILFKILNWPLYLFIIDPLFFCSIFSPFVLHPSGEGRGMLHPSPLLLGIAMTPFGLPRVLSSIYSLLETFFFLLWFMRVRSGDSLEWLVITGCQLPSDKRLGNWVEFGAVGVLLALSVILTKLQWQW